MRRFLGWEPAEVTTFEYDGSGRLVRAVTVREPEYSDLDRRWLAKSFEDEKTPRGSHGVPISEATDPQYRGKWVVPAPVIDFVEVERVAAAEKAKKTYGDAFPTSAFRFTVERKP